MAITSIEKLLHWAFVMEIPKGRDGSPIGAAIASSWGVVDRFAVLGTLIDAGGRVDMVSTDDPDPDAEAVVAAVAALDELVVEEGEEHDLLAGWPPFGLAGDEAVARAWEIITRVDAVGRRVLRSPLSILIRRIAVLGEWPDWRGDCPRIDVATGPEGKPRWFRIERQEVWWDEATGEPTRWADVEVDGYDKRSQRPLAGSYRKSVLVPDPAPVLAKRIEFGLVHAALCSLAASLDGLGGRRVSAPDHSPTPWATCGEVEKSGA